MSSALVMLSGGLDSAVALAWASKTFESIKALSFQYHLRPFREHLSVLRLLQTFPATLLDVPLPFLKEAGDAGTKLAERAPAGYISNRNMIFYSIAAYYAEHHECAAVIGGHTAEDQEAFSDASPLFFSRLEHLINDGMQLSKIEIKLPLSNLTKVQVLQKAIEWNVPLEATWSCYYDRMNPCGKCISCVERADAFRTIGLPDPLCTI